MGRRLDAWAPPEKPQFPGPTPFVPRARPATAPETLPRRGIVGYAPGAFDLFHVGHLNVLRQARMNCDQLIAGVVSDEIVLKQKGRSPVVPEAERLAIVEGLRCVDEAYLEVNTDKMISWSSLLFDVIFKGDDWQGTPQGDRLEHTFAAGGVSVVYLPYTQHTSTTRLRELVDLRAAS